ncbi:peptidoglycan editing factor PgeF [Neobacillus piezotolerans]|uniref:Purine nucleoside phosphorylase n=1 Tax=Neobacillus piezotolerans TaxID=2259171 RepID=A0A3D8GWR1_9BACI|nr:peptidoglycan editing factor PgeF [Neobacillus piezotolerans]RDU38496.1 peptidoglycan editing factor PgeF [Neobacillus piezotolerans]
MEPFISQNESVLFLDGWLKDFPGLSAGFTTKCGGASSGEFESMNAGYHVGDNPGLVKKNREAIANLAGFALEDIVGAEQTHGTNIVKAGPHLKGRGAASYSDSVKDTDGFYTNEKGILLSLCFADCVPLYFFSPDSGLVGIAHAGWKGTVDGIGPKMVEAWKAEGVSPSGIFAAIGPSICKNCYIVDDRVIGFAEKRLEHVEKKPYNQISVGQYSLDLRAMNKILLEEAGIPARNIAITGLCSSCGEGNFYSHRRDRGKTGRMLGFIGWKEGSSR